MLIELGEISEVTINKCYKKLETIQQYLIPKGVIDNMLNI